MVLPVDQKLYLKIRWLLSCVDVIAQQPGLRTSCCNWVNEQHILICLDHRLACAVLYLLLSNALVNERRRWTWSSFSRLQACLCQWLAHLSYRFRLSETGCFCFCRRSPPGMFRPMGLLSEYRIEHVTIGFLYVKFIFSTRISCKGVPCSATDFQLIFGVWCRLLTTCFQT